MPDDPDALAQAFRAELRRAAPDFKFHIWLEPLEAAALRDGTLYVRAPDHIRTWVGGRYGALLHDAAIASLGAGRVEVVPPDWRPGADEPQTTSSRAAPLNPKYTFDQFVIGDTNRFAHAAALAVAELPAQAYNPLFIHGPPGLGKTHLLHAIGNYVGRFGSGLTVRYATVEEFTRAFVDAVRERRTSAFKDVFRSADVLLVDDVQFLAAKERTGEEFFHTFNALQGSGRQLVLTSDRGPDDLAGLEDRLAERFRAGLVVGLEPPEFAVRRAILAKRATLDGVEIGPDVLDELARLVTSSVRALEGALIQVVAYASLRGEKARPDTVRHVLGRLAPPQTSGPITIAAVLDATASTFNVKREELLARGRRRDVSTARQVGMFVARELTGRSLPEIGRGFGGRDHTTVLHAVRRVRDAVADDDALASAVDRLRHAVHAPSERPTRL